MKKTFPILLFILWSSATFANEKCSIIINTTNADIKNEFYIMSQSTLICEGIQKKTDTFQVEIQEPLPCFYIQNEDTGKLCIFWIEPGIVHLQINANSVRESKVIGSSLNNDFYNSKFEEDSIYELVGYNPIVFDDLKNPISIAYYHHQKKLEQKIYKAAFKKTNLFSTLQFVKFQLSEYLLKKKKATFSKKELWKLFKKVNPKMKTYPTYQTCLSLFRQKVADRPTINEPLMQ